MATKTFPVQHQKSAVIFGFRGTITGGGVKIKKPQRSSIEHNNKPPDTFDVRDKVFGGETRVNMIKNLLGDLEKIGVSCFIVSFEESGKLNKLLGAPGVKMQALFNYIVSKEDMEKYFPESDTMATISDAVTSIMKHMGIDSASRVFFLDSSAGNVRDVMRQLPGCCTHWVKHDHGLGQSHCDTIRLWAELRHDKPLTYTDAEHVEIKRIQQSMFLAAKKRTHAKSSDRLAMGDTLRPYRERSSTI